MATRADRVQRREKKSDDREAELRAAITAILTGKNAPMTRKELWEALPDELRVSENRFLKVLEAGVGEQWNREGNGGRDSYRYSAVEEE